MSKAAATPSSPSPRQVLSVQFLEKHNGKKDLVRRLRTVSNVLHHDPNVEPDSSDFPGLAAMASCLVEDFLGHKDKEVRIYTVLCCMELFAIYAPEAPWNDTEVCYIFQQTIRQMANLAHTTSPSQSHYESYVRILELLAEVKIGVVLVDLAKTVGDVVQEDEDFQQGLVVDSPLELLCELFRTLLQSLRMQHPNEIAEYSQKIVSGCLEEYHGGSGIAVPLPLVEEILISVGQPTIFVTSPAAMQQQATKNSKAGKKRKAPAIPQQEEHQNPSHMVAAAVVRKHLSSLSTPVSNLLNGLINGEPHIVQRSSISADDDGDGDPQSEAGVVDVWTIVYELGRVAPSILTTVIGTISNCLSSPEDSKRHQTVKLLGRLFYAKGSKLACKFAPCFRQWVGRHADRDPAIRMTMVTGLVSILKSNPDPEVVRESDATLVKMLHDKNSEVRRAAVGKVSDFVLSNMKENPVSAELLLGLGSRVGSKDPKERIDALTGISLIYYTHYMLDALRDIQKAGDDYDIELVSQVLNENCSQADVFHSGGGDGRRNCHDKDKLDWIPSRVFECMCFSTDPQMQGRVVGIVDGILVGSELSRKASKKLTPTARAVGVTIIVDSLRKAGESAWNETNTSNAFMHMMGFFRQRARLQKTLGIYIDARSKIREHTAGTEQALAADVTAREKLQVLAAMLPPPSGADVDDVLEQLHLARDKHIFRILAGLADPRHGKSTRARALDELPKRTKSLGDSVQDWVMTLVHRCSMGDFFNAETVRSCISLASECFSEKDTASCVGLLACVKVAISVFPSLCDDAESFQLLKEMFSACRGYASSTKKGAMKRQVEESGLATALSSILTVVARKKQCTNQTEPVQASTSADAGLRRQLLQVCTKDGTPQQARNAVETLVTLYSGGHDSTRDNANESISSLLKELTSPSKMTIISESGKSDHVVSILSALAALVERAPHTVSCSERGEKAVRFALETILLGRSARSSNDDSSDSSDDADGNERLSAKKSPRRGSGSSKMHHRSPAEEKYLLENTDLSVATRVVCAAIEFLVSYVRSTTLASKATQACTPQSSADSDDHPEVITLSTNRLKTLFGILTQIIRDQGIPPSNRDRKDCRARQDRAAIRQCAAVQLLRLCDGRLKLEATYLSTEMWHTLSGIFLDEERIVRQAVMDELVDLMTGKGIFGSHGQAKCMAPALRFVAFVVFCADGIGGAGHCRANNGNAANVGKSSHRAMMAAQTSANLLRNACDNAFAQCCVGGDQMEKKYEAEVTPLMMPEYVVPHAFHLLAFRRETPSLEATKKDRASAGAGQKPKRPSDGSSNASDEAQQRMLKKRLKWLFQPLVQSLGDGADNISFLLYMIQKLNLCSPIDASKQEASMIASPGSHGSFDDEFMMSPAASPKQSGCDVSGAKLGSISDMARTVLLSFVKSDVNLSDYPGVVRIPTRLFKMTASNATLASEGAAMQTRDNGAKRARRGRNQQSSEVHFSPNVGSPDGMPSPPGGMLSLSPILKRSSPGSESETKTLTPGGMTDRETPMSTLSAKRGLGEQQQNQLFEQNPLLSSSTAPDEESSSGGDQELPVTQEEESQPKRKRRTSSGVPAQIKIGRKAGSSKSPVRRGSNGGKSSQKSVFNFDDDDEMHYVKPLGDSNSNRTSSKRRKEVVEEESPLPRKGTRSSRRNRA